MKMERDKKVEREKEKNIVDDQQECSIIRGLFERETANEKEVEKSTEMLERLTRAAVKIGWRE